MLSPPRVGGRGRKWKRRPTTVQAHANGWLRRPCGEDGHERERTPHQLSLGVSFLDESLAVGRHGMASGSGQAARHLRRSLRREPRRSLLRQDPAPQSQLQRRPPTPPCTRSPWHRCAGTPAPARTSSTASAKAGHAAKPSAASNATLPARFTRRSLRSGTARRSQDQVVDIHRGIELALRYEATVLVQPSTSGYEQRGGKTPRRRRTRCLPGPAVRRRSAPCPARPRSEARWRQLRSVFPLW